MSRATTDLYVNDVELEATMVTESSDNYVSQSDLDLYRREFCTIRE